VCGFQPRVYVYMSDVRVGLCMFHAGYYKCVCVCVCVFSLSLSLLDIRDTRALSLPPSLPPSLPLSLSLARARSLSLSLLDIGDTHSGGADARQKVATL